MKQAVLVIWQHRKMLWATTMADIRSRYAGSVLGLSWLILYPALLLATYSIVYGFIFRVRLGMDISEYILMIFAGLIPFLGISESLSSSVVSVTANSALVKNTLYPIEIIPVKAVLASQCTGIVGMALFIVALVLFGHLSWWILLVFPIWFFQILFCIGIAWIISSLQVIIEDMKNVITIIIMVLMMLSPIAYTTDMVSGEIKLLLLFNPLYYFISAYRDCLLQGCFPRGYVFWALAAFSLIVYWGGYVFFSKMKQLFDDEL